MKRFSLVVAGIVFISAALFVSGTTHNQSGEDQVQIGAVFAEDEEIVIEHTGEPNGSSVNLAGWSILSLGDAGGEDIDQIFRFPKATCVLEAGSQLTVFAGAEATDPANTASAGCLSDELYWDVTGNGPLVWNNSGDTACLLNEHLALVHQYPTGGGTSLCNDDYSASDNEGSS